MNNIFYVALLPLIIQIILWVVFGSRSNTMAKGKLAGQLKKMADKAVGIEDCKIENIISLEELFDNNTPKSFIEKWNLMKGKIENYNDGMFIPSGETFFSYDDLIENKVVRSMVKFMWAGFLLLGLLSITLPIAIALVFEPADLMMAAGYGLGAFSLMAVGQLIFTAACELNIQKAKNEYDRFITQFNRIAPVVDNSTAAILNAINKNNKIVDLSTKMIVAKFAEFENEVILPALKRSLETIAERQDQGMRILASEFANYLTNTLNTSMNNLTKTINEIQTGLMKLNDGLVNNTGELSDILLQQRRALEEATDMLVISRQAQTEALEQADKIQVQAMNNTAELKNQVGVMVETVDELKNQNVLFIQQAAELMTKSVDMQQQVGEQLSSFKDWIEFAMKEESNRIENIAGSINTSMTLAGGEISESIKEQNAAFAEQASSIIDRATDIQQQVGEQLVSYKEWIDTVMREEAVIMDNITNSIRESMVLTCSNMASSLTAQNNEFAQQANDLITKATDIQLQVGEQLLSYKEWIDAMIKEETQSLNGIASNIKDSLAAAGGVLASAIKETTGDNAEAIQQIAEQASLLRADYDNYFSRLEDYSRDTYEQMDYHMQNVMAKITEEVEKLLGENVKTSLSIMDDYRNSNTELLSAFKEQATSFSLYASEINLDVNALSENLKNSVATFSDSLQTTVSGTINNFDEGLAELSKRIANTVESIRDAVEALPAAIEKK